MQKIISFDIWDTLLKRKCNPEEIKLFTARYMLFKYENKIKDEYDLIMINCPMSSDNFGGGSLRFNWEVIMTFWDGYVINHPRVIFTSFGDPYRIYDVPYMKTYLNAYSNFPETQKAVAKAVLGIESIVGKSPVEFKGFFEREV